MAGSSNSGGGGWNWKDYTLFGVAFFVGMLLYSMYFIAYDMFQDLYCYKDFVPQTSEKTETDVLIDSENATPSGIPTSLSDCLQNFKLLPALMEELSKSIR